jgi:hypothetical protein
MFMTSRNINVKLLILLSILGLFFLLVTYNRNTLTANFLAVKLVELEKKSRLTSAPIIKPVTFVFTGNASDLESQHKSRASLSVTSSSVTTHTKPYDFYKDLVGQPNKLVDKYIGRPLDYGYGSGLIPLLAAALSTYGDILELGMGTFSTGMLHKIALSLNRTVVSVDSDSAWVQQMLKFQHEDLHKLFLMPTKDDMHKFGRDKLWGLVLVDHIYGGERAMDVKAFSNRAQIVIAHDAERQNEGLYHYEESKIRDNFKYVCKYSLFRNKEKTEYISTYILSNYVDLDFLYIVFDKITTDFGASACDYYKY